MSGSPLLDHARRRLAQQRAQEQERWTTSAASQKKNVGRYVLRGIAISALLILMFLYYRG